MLCSSVSAEDSAWTQKDLHTSVKRIRTFYNISTGHLRKVQSAAGFDIKRCKVLTNGTGIWFKLRLKRLMLKAAFSISLSLV